MIRSQNDPNSRKLVALSNISLKKVVQIVPFNMKKKNFNSQGRRLADKKVDCDKVSDRIKKIKDDIEEKYKEFSQRRFERTYPITKKMRDGTVKKLTDEYKKKTKFNESWRKDWHSALIHYIQCDDFDLYNPSDMRDGDDLTEKERNTKKNCKDKLDVDSKIKDQIKKIPYPDYKYRKIVSPEDADDNKDNDVTKKNKKRQECLENKILEKFENLSDGITKKKGKCTYEKPKKASKSKKMRILRERRLVIAMNNYSTPLSPHPKDKEIYFKIKVLKRNLNRWLAYRSSKPSEQSMSELLDQCHDRNRMLSLLRYQGDKFNFKNKGKNSKKNEKNTAWKLNKPKTRYNESNDDQPKDNLKIRRLNNTDDSKNKNDDMRKDKDNKDNEKNTDSSKKTSSSSSKTKRRLVKMYDTDDDQEVEEHMDDRVRRLVENDNEETDDDDDDEEDYETKRALADAEEEDSNDENEDDTRALKQSDDKDNNDEDEDLDDDNKRLLNENDDDDDEEDDDENKETDDGNTEKKARKLLDGDEKDDNEEKRLLKDSEEEDDNDDANRRRLNKARRAADSDKEDTTDKSDDGDKEKKTKKDSQNDDKGKLETDTKRRLFVTPRKLEEGTKKDSKDAAKEAKESVNKTSTEKSDEDSSLLRRRLDVDNNKAKNGSKDKISDEKKIDPKKEKDESKNSLLIWRLDAEDDKNKDESKDEASDEKKPDAKAAKDDAKDGKRMVRRTMQIPSQKISHNIIDDTKYIKDMLFNAHNRVLTSINESPR